MPKKLTINDAYEMLDIAPGFAASERPTVVRIAKLIASGKVKSTADLAPNDLHFYDIYFY